VSRWGAGLDLPPRAGSQARKRQEPASGGGGLAGCGARSARSGGGGGRNPSEWRARHTFLASVPPGGCHTTNVSKVRPRREPPTISWRLSAAFRRIFAVKARSTVLPRRDQHNRVRKHDPPPNRPLDARLWSGATNTTGPDNPPLPSHQSEPRDFCHKVLVSFTGGEGIRSMEKVGGCGASRRRSREKERSWRTRTAAR
jgi:hypothetical protein